MKRLAAGLMGLVSLMGAVHAADRNCLPEAIETLLFVDHTTRLTQLDEQQLLDGANLIVERMPVGGRLTVKAIRGAYSEVRTLHQACKPGCPPGAGALSCSEITVKRRDLPAFLRGLEASLRDTFGKPTADRSEIAVSLAYGLRTSGESRPRRVYVFSDMLERSTLTDMMAAGSPFITGRGAEAFAALQRKMIAGGFDTRIDGSEIIVFGFGREDGAHRPLEIQVAQRVKLFWTALFTAMGAQSVRFFSDLDR